MLASQSIGPAVPPGELALDSVRQLVGLAEVNISLSIISRWRLKLCNELVAFSWVHVTREVSDKCARECASLTPK